MQQTVDIRPSARISNVFSTYLEIIVACEHKPVPPPLIQQLDDSGRMVIPVGPPGGYQSLFLITKEGEQVKSRNLGGVRFVPLTR